MQTDRLSSLTFKDATKCHACVIHRSRSPKQRCSALYSTYCQCIIQQFTVSGCSLNGTERSMAHEAPLASQPRSRVQKYAYVCMSERPAQQSDVNIFRFSIREIYSISPISPLSTRGLTEGPFPVSCMCKQTHKRKMISILPCTHKQN